MERTIEIVSDAALGDAGLREIVLKSNFGVILEYEARAIALEEASFDWVSGHDNGEVWKIEEVNMYDFDRTAYITLRPEKE